MPTIDKLKYVESVDRNEYYSNVFKFLVQNGTITNDDLCYILDQIEISIPPEDISYHMGKLISSIYSFTLSKLLSNGYVKFQIKLVELLDKYRGNLDTSKLNSKNLYTSGKKLALICLNGVFLKFGGFLNSFKMGLLTACYKHLKKMISNSSKEIDSNYFNQFLVLIDTLLMNSPPIDNKTFQRLLKLHKLIGAKSKTYTAEKEYYYYSVLSVIYVNNILTTLLRSPFYINALTSRKSQQNPLHYMHLISPYLTYLVSCTNTRFKNLRLSSTRNITDLLIYNYVNYGVEDNEGKVFNFMLKYLWNQYTKISNDRRVKTAVIEILMQIMSGLNLIFESGAVPHAKNFISFKSFDILNITITKLFTTDVEEGSLLLNSNTDFNTAIFMLNHLKIFYNHLLKEVKSDVNKLIILQHLFDEYLSVDAANDAYKVNSLLQLSQLIITDLGQFILTMDTTKMKETLFRFLTNKNPYIRVLAIQTLAKLNFSTDRIITDSFKDLNELIGLDAKPKENEDTFIETHLKSLLVASIMSSVDSVSTDFLLSVLSFSSSILKKFNSNVSINNLINGSDYSTLSNTNYEKQISSWILMMGLFNHYQRQKNPFLMGSNPLLNIWKSLLAHNVPSKFIKVENNRIVNFNELMKFIEIKNYSLSCLVCFIHYAISLNSMPPDFAKQLTPLLTKCYSFIINVERQLPPNIPSSLFKSIQIQKLRILTNFVKILPHIIKLTDEVNVSTDLLLNVVKNFNDYKLFNYKISVVEHISSKNLKAPEVTEYDIYHVDDGLAFGLTSKINQFQIDELLFKNTEFTQDNSIDIDTIPGSQNFLIESHDSISNLSELSKFDELESLITCPIQSSIMNDYLFYLMSNNRPYSNTRQDVVPVETATIDLSIELFQLVFPYLSLKIQQSVLEHIRTGMLHSPELMAKPTTTVTPTDKPLVQNEFFNYERQRAVVINSSVAIHGMLSHLQHKNDKRLKLNRIICNLIMETLRGISINDLFLVNLNAESIGLSLSVLDGDNHKIITESVNYFINMIVANNDPYSRVFCSLCLGFFFKFNSNSTNVSSILDVILKLVLDPHPIVHHWSLESLILVLENYLSYAGLNALIGQVVMIMDKIYGSDDYGLQSKSTITSNLNLTFEGGDKNVLLTKLCRVIVKLVGPGMMQLTLRLKLQSLILKMMFLTTTNFDLVSREMIALNDELSLFDKSLIGDHISQIFLQFQFLSNVKTGVYHENLLTLPFVDTIVGAENIDNEVFPITTSETLLKLSINSLLQSVKVSTDAKSLQNILTDDILNVLWILMESDNQLVYQIMELLIDVQFHGDLPLETKFQWVETLITKFGYTERELYKPLNNFFKKKIQGSPSLFALKPKTTTAIKQGNQESQSFLKLDQDDAGDDSDASEDTNVISMGVEDSSATPIESNVEKDDDPNGIRGAKVQKISDEEPVNWQLKLKSLNLLIKLLSYARQDDMLLKYLSTRLSELVRISFVACTSLILESRSLGLELLKLILVDYSHLRDPLYENLSILDQQQAQIISAIMPAFANDSNIELVCKGFEICSILISSHITSLTRLTKLVKVLVKSLHDLSLLTVNKRSDNNLKIGDVLVKNVLEQKKVTLAVLNSWANLKSQGMDDPELVELVDEHLKILVTLWIYSLKQYSILKYGKEFMETDAVPVENYGDYWQNIAMAVSIVIKDDPALIETVLGAELNNFFFTIFAQCVEKLFKGNNLEILLILRNVLTLKSSSVIIYHELIFTEVVDLFDRLSIRCDNNLKLILIDIITELYLSYFDNEVGKTRMEQDKLQDVDRLFELMRLLMSYIVKVLPFIKDKAIEPDKLHEITPSDIKILQKTFTSLLQMIDKLPVVIQNDLYSCLLYLISLIYQLDNNELIGVVLPNLKKILSELTIQGQLDTIAKFYQSIKPIISNNNSWQNSLITYMIFATTTDGLVVLSQDDFEHISELLVSSLCDKESQLIVTKSIKTLILQAKNDNARHILRQLVPKLIKIIINNQLQESRIGIELLIIFIKTLGESYIEGLKLIIPLLLWYSVHQDEKLYINLKLIDLIQFNPEMSKKYISENISDDDKRLIEDLVKYNEVNGDNFKDEIERQHINLKTFGK